MTGRDEDYCYQRMPLRRVFTLLHVHYYLEGVKVVPASTEALSLAELINM